jgi:uncharacterized protein YkwD
MVSKGTLSHDNVNSRYDAIYKNVSGMHNVAENVLQGNAPCDANAMAQQWWNSAGHKANIMNAKLTIGSMGIVVDSSGRIFACQLFAGP